MKNAFTNKRRFDEKTSLLVLNRLTKGIILALEI